MHREGKECEELVSTAKRWQLECREEVNLVSRGGERNTRRVESGIINRTYLYDGKISWGGLIWNVFGSLSALIILWCIFPLSRAHTQYKCMMTLGEDNRKGWMFLILDFPSVNVSKTICATFVCEDSRLQIYYQTQLKSVELKLGIVSIKVCVKWVVSYLVSKLYIYEEDGNIFSELEQDGSHSNTCLYSNLMWLSVETKWTETYREP